MPRVTIDMYPGRSKEQKAELAQVITRALVDIANAKPESVDIVFKEVSKDDWAFSGTLASDEEAMNG